MNSRKGRNIILVSYVLIFAIITTVLFLTVGYVNEGWRQSKGFWVAFAFTIPVNFISAVIIHLWTGHKDAVDIVQMPVMYFIVAGANVCYLATGFFFMYRPIFSEITIPLIVGLAITVVYIIATMFGMYGTNYITKQQKYTKEKVNFIRMLEADLNDCKLKTDNKEVLTALSVFSDNVHFSDPMSHKSLEGIESELASNISRISMVIGQGQIDTALSLIKEGEDLLAQRNKRCIMLK